MPVYRNCDHCDGRIGYLAGELERVFCGVADQSEDVCPECANYLRPAEPEPEPEEEEEPDEECDLCNHIGDDVRVFAYTGEFL